MWRDDLAKLFFGALVLLLVACSSSEKIVADDAGASSTATDSVEGSRLKARVFTGQDGTKQFSGWFDTSRQEPCSFQKLIAGIYCLPEMAVADQKTYFSDAACTIPLTTVVVPQCNTPKTALVISNISECSVADKVIQLSEPFAGVVFTKSPSCQAVSSVIGPSYYFFKSSSDVSLSFFVSATEALQ